MYLKLKRKGKIFLISDEHYYNSNIIKCDNRPFKDVVEMREIMIAKHNAIVTPEDTTFHLGDFCMSKDPENAKRIIERLNGDHYFLKGSHDEWLPPEHPERYMFSYNSYFIVLDHYQMDHWPRSHHGSLHFFGHQHGRSKSENIKGNKMEVFCGDFDYAPVELDVLIKKIISKPDYFRGINFSKQ